MSGDPAAPNGSRPQADAGPGAAAPPTGPPTALLAAQGAAAVALLWYLPPLFWQLLRPEGFESAAASEVDIAALDMTAFALAAGVVVLFGLVSPRPAPFLPVRAPAVVAVYVPAAALWLVLTIGYLRAMAAFGHPVPMQAALGMVGALSWSDPRVWQLALAIVVAAPLAEELIFRGYLQTALQRALPPWPANLVTALAFGAVHGAAYLVPIAILGAVFGWLRQRHGSLLPSMFAHMLHNALTMAVALHAPQALDWMYAR